jgi:hypothetical protein
MPSVAAPTTMSLERPQMLGQRLADALAETHAHVDHHQQRDGELLVDRHDG